VGSRLPLFAGNNSGFNLYDLHAVVGEQRGSQWTGILLREIRHAQTGERGLMRTIVDHGRSIGVWNIAFKLCQDFLSVLIEKRRWAAHTHRR